MGWFHQIAFMLGRLAAFASATSGKQPPRRALDGMPKPGRT
jgi:hypothetical protein